MRIAKFPHHKDFATFDYGAATVTKAQVDPFCSGQFTDDAHNIILVGGTGTGKTHISIALGTNLVNRGKRVRFYNAVDLINALIAEQAEGNTGRGKHRPRETQPKSSGKIIRQLTALDCVIIDELVYIPFPKSGGSLLFHLLLSECMHSPASQRISKL
jgi:DNA replication protein DnaC